MYNEKRSQVEILFLKMWYYPNLFFAGNGLKHYVQVEVCVHI